VLFFQDDLLHALLLEIAEGLRRVLKATGAVAGFRGRHGGRQVDEPLGIEREPGHHLKGGPGVLLPDGDLLHQAGVDEPLPEHVIEIQKLVVFLLGA